jgi:hypothetical protein
VLVYYFSRLLSPAGLTARSTRLVPDRMHHDMYHGHTGKHAVISETKHAQISVSACTVE